MTKRTAYIFLVIVSLGFMANIALGALAIDNYVAGRAPVWVLIFTGCGYIVSMSFFVPVLRRVKVVLLAPESKDDGAEERKS